MYIYPLINPSGCWRYWTFSYVDDNLRQTLLGHRPCYAVFRRARQRNSGVVHSEERIWKIRYPPVSSNMVCWKFSLYYILLSMIFMLPAIDLH